MATKGLSTRKQQSNGGAATGVSLWPKEKLWLGNWRSRRPKEKSWHGNLGIAPTKRKVAARQSWNRAGQQKSCGAAILGLRWPKEKSPRGNLGIAPAKKKLLRGNLENAPAKKKFTARQSWNRANLLRNCGKAIGVLRWERLIPVQQSSDCAGKKNNHCTAIKWLRCYKIRVLWYLLTVLTYQSHITTLWQRSWHPITLPFTRCHLDIPHHHLLRN